MSGPGERAPVLDAATLASLRRRVGEAQRDWRSPSVVVRVLRHGEPVLDVAVGGADLGPDGLADPPPLAAGPDVQYRVGSITKTFTAALVLQARDAGLLDLDDRLDAHLDVGAHGGLTLRRMLAHVSGLQREPVGDVWASMQSYDLDELLARMPQAQAVLAPRERWHYSNLAFALLGHVVGAVRGTTWEQALQQHLLDPLGLARTTTAPTAPVARGYFVDPWADRLRPEPLFDGRSLGPALELWSTPTDLARWAAFWAEPDPAVLAPVTVREMTHLHAMADLRQWTLGWGLGLFLHRRGERVLVGHDGAMPGFLSSFVTHLDSATAVAVVTSTSRVADPAELALHLAEAVLDATPEPVAPWRPGAPVPPDVEPLLGHWWSEGVEYVLSWRSDPDRPHEQADGADGGHVELAGARAPAGTPPSVLRRDGNPGSGRFRVVSGREQGEPLRAVRAADGTVERLVWATYQVTRDPRPFGL